VEKLNRNLLLIISITLFVALIPFLVLSDFVRFQADDYCSSTLVRSEGFWKAQQSSYENWSGRYSTMFFIAIIDRLDLIGLRILPIILIIGIWVTSYLLLYSISKFLKCNITKSVIFCISLAITFFMLVTTPNLYQSLYWRSGSITYTLPIILFNLLLVMLIDSLNNKVSWWKTLTCILLSFISMGFSETNTAMQLLLLFLLLIILFKYKHSRKNAILNVNLWILALLAGIIGLIVLMFAPGNRIRMNYMPQPPEFIRLFYMSNRFALGLAYNIISSNLAIRFISLLTGITMGLVLPITLPKFTHKTKLNALGIIIVIYLLIFAACVPSAYAESAFLEERAQTYANYIITYTWIVGSTLIGAYFANKLSGNLKRILAIALLTISVLYIAREAIHFSKTLPDYYEKAILWDARADFIRDQRELGKLDLIVPSIDSIDGLFELSPDSNHWVNLCAAGYYQVDSLSGID